VKNFTSTSRVNSTRVVVLCFSTSSCQLITYLRTTISRHEACTIYIADIEHWIAVSRWGCDIELVETGTCGKTSKRPYPTPDPETFLPSKRRCRERRASDSDPDTDTETVNDMVADDEGGRGPNAEYRGLISTPPGGNRWGQGKPSREIGGSGRFNPTNKQWPNLYDNITYAR